MSGASADAAAEEPLAGTNEGAPIVGRSEIEIAAAPEIVWSGLTAFERWPAWNHDVKSISSRGGAAAPSVWRRGALGEADGLTTEGGGTERGRSYPGGTGRSRFTFCGSWIRGTPLDPEGT